MLHPDDEFESELEWARNRSLSRARLGGASPTGSPAEGALIAKEFERLKHCAWLGLSVFDLGQTAPDTGGGSAMHGDIMPTICHHSGLLWHSQVAR